MEMSTSEQLVIKNKFGYYEIKDKPTVEVLEKHYQEKYYTESKTYQTTYSEEEKENIINAIDRKYIALQEWLSLPKKVPTLLDVGAGEGFVLNYFNNLGWRVQGLEFTQNECNRHNPQVLEKMIVGDIYQNLSSLIDSSEGKFDIVWLAGVLEHVLDPEKLLDMLLQVISDSGILVVLVPNDFSDVQKYLTEKGYISGEFWVCPPSHLSYFNKSGLTNLCEAVGWNVRRCLGSYPIDFQLFHSATNYVNKPQTGRDSYLASVAIEGIMHKVSPELLNDYFESLANLGMGRDITVFLTK